MPEPATRRPPLVARGDRRPPLRPTPLLWAVLLVVAVPIVASVVQHSTGGWVPEGDDAWVGRRVRQVFTSDPPLIGQESTADDAPTDRGLSHPGPVAYYLLALPYGASGWSPVGLVVGAGLVVLAAAWAAVVAAWRAAGDRGALAAGVALALLAVRLGQEWLVRPTSSTTVVLPLLATAFGLWAYLRGDRLGLAVALLAGTYTLQTSLVVLPISVVLVGATVVLAAWRRWARGHGDLSTAGWAVVGVLALLWLPPLVQAVASWPGNLVQLGEYLLASVGLVERPGTTAGALGLGEAAATVATYAFGLPGTDGRTLDGPAVWLVAADELSPVRLALGAGVVAATAAWAWLGRSVELLRLLVIVVVCAGAGVVAFAFRPTDSLLAQTYFVVWIQGLAALLWTAVAYAAIDAATALAARRDATAEGRRRRRVPTPVALGALAVAVLAAGVASVGTVPRTDQEHVADLSAQLREQLPVGTYAVVGQGPQAWSSTAKGVGLELLTDGYDIRFTEWGGMVDEPRLRATRADDVLLITSEYPDLPDAAMLARRRTGDLDLQVHLIPGGPNASFCLATGATLRPALVATDEGAAATVGATRQAIEAFDADAAALAAPDGPVEDAVATFARERPAALAALEGRPDDEVLTAAVLPAPFTAATSTLVASFAEVCAPPRTR